MNISNILSTTTRVYNADNNYATEVKLRLNKAYTDVMNSNILNHDQYASLYNKTAKPHSIQPGCLVLVRNEIKAGSNMRKLNNRFTGPYRVLKFIGKNSILIKDVQGKLKESSVHTNRCKVFKIDNDAYPNFHDLVSSETMSYEDQDQEIESEISELSSDEE